jgi:rod shape-determining protein MreC
MALPRHTGRSKFSLFVLLLASVTLLSLDARDFGPVETLKDGLSAVVSPLRSAGDAVLGPIGDAWSDIGGDEDLEAENQRLREQIAALLEERIDNAGAAEELAELRTILGLEGPGSYDTVVAEVTAGSVSNFDPYVLEIDKGTSDGIGDGMPVVVAEGLVGRIEDARPGSARVRLLTDPDVSVGVLVVGTPEIGIVRGAGEGHPLRVTESVRVGAPVQEGDLLVTSGLDRSPYPEGLAVGMVSAIEVDEAGLDLQLVVEPTAPLSDLNFVMVVLYDPESADLVDPAAEGAP